MHVPGHHKPRRIGRLHDAELTERVLTRRFDHDSAPVELVGRAFMWIQHEPGHHCSPPFPAACMYRVSQPAVTGRRLGHPGGPATAPSFAAPGAQIRAPCRVVLPTALAVW